jgi:D-inositol-3-phosphate glycosyltransferase
MTGRRKTVLWCGDAVVSTGFARATHKIINGLLPDWDVAVLGLNYHGDPHDYPYKIYPCKNPLTGATNAFGLQRLAELIKKHGPDVVVVQNDPWNIPYYLKACGNVPVVGFVAVDGKNCRGAGMNGLANAVFWTRFGEEQAKLGGYSGQTAVVPLGVDLDVYRPLDRAAVRKMFSGPREFGPRFPVDGFIVGVVGRNQVRKRLDLAVQYFAAWVKGLQVDDAYLYLHVGPTGDEGFDLSQLPRYYGIANRVIVDEAPLGAGWTEERLNQTYNAFDVLLSTSQAEGWNLPAMEAMAAGVPCVLPAWAAHTEWPEDAAELVPCTATCCTPNNINVVCGIPDLEGTVAALDRLYRDRAHRSDLSVRGQVLAAKPRYRWPAVAEAFKVALEASLDGGTNRRLSQPLLEEVSA